MTIETMKVEVVNVRNFPLEAPTPYIYVGRYMPGTFRGHPLANPFKLPSKATAADRMDCLRQYEVWLDRLSNRDDLLQRLAAQVQRTGLPLGCWCKPKACHADILARRVEGIIREQLKGGAA